MLIIRPAGQDRYALYEDAAYTGGVTVYPKGDIFSLGILIVPAMRRRGLALQALNQITQMYFDRGFKACVNHVAADNIASIRLHERAGFMWEAESLTAAQRVLTFKKSGVI